MNPFRAHAEYRRLAARFREGKPLTADARARLHAYAVENRNYLLAERTQ